MSSTGSEGARAIDRLAKAVFGVAAAIVLLMLALLLMGVASLFSGSGQKGAATAWVPDPPAVFAAPWGDRQSALLSTAIEALAHAAEAGRAAPGSDQQLLAGLAGGGVGLAIGVLAALLYGALSRAEPRVHNIVVPAPAAVSTPVPAAASEGKAAPP